MTPQALIAAQDAAIAAREDGVAMQALIPSIADGDEAAMLLREIQARARELEKKRDEILRPLREATRKIDELFKPALDAYARAKGFVKDYLQRDIEAKRAEQRDAISAGNAQAAVAVSMPRVQTRKVLRWRIVDSDTVPPEYWEISDKLVGEALRAGVVVPGVETFWEETIVAR